jgi:uncharacterized membrane protein YfcA
MKQKRNKQRGFDTFIRYSSLGFEMMAIIGLGTFLGFKIDHWMGNEFKAFTFGLMIISVVVSVLFGVRNLLKK